MRAIYPHRSPYDCPWTSRPPIFFPPSTSHLRGVYRPRPEVAAQRPSKDGRHFVKCFSRCTAPSSRRRFAASAFFQEGRRKVSGVPAFAGMTICVRTHFHPPLILRGSASRCTSGRGGIFVTPSRHPSESWGPLKHFSNDTFSGDASFRRHDDLCTDHDSDKPRLSPRRGIGYRQSPSINRVRRHQEATARNRR
jgi:hypothetical protein